MKKILILLFAGLLLAACSDGGEATEDTGEENTNSTTENDTETDSETSGEEDQDQKQVYQIGETATITSDMYEFDYEVTVNDFNLTKEVDGNTIEDYITGAREQDVFAVVDVTIKNISDESYVPNQMFSANLSAIDEDGGDTSYDELFPEGEEELAPGDEVNGHVVYTTTTDYADTFLLKYEFMSDQETHFELPNPGN
ncbi:MULTISPECIES: DUF4352 domain-containing protein [Gracilibacillus]|uniref:DUF4352 domain-containing protein n=1 Tax=Gracilibacillus TaxID=74385 RepID=UPI00082702C0|nr:MULTISPECIES: DUF4352 domain-containing protein [Gracilibacillus]